MSVEIRQVTLGWEDLQSLFSPLPQLSHSLLPLPQTQTSLFQALTCGNEPVLQCTTSGYCCREGAGGGGKGQILKGQKWMLVSAWKDSKDWNSWNDFCSEVLLLHLIFLTPVQSSAWCCFSRDIRTLGFSSSFCMCSHDAANTPQVERKSIQEREGKALDFSKIPHPSS